MECTEIDCPVDGDWSKWSQWNACSLSCNGGYMTRYRKCDSPVPAFNGSDCRGDNLQNITCNTNLCPVNGSWSSWSDWNTCSVTCGNGYKKRQRSCDNPSPVAGGRNCYGDATEIKNCKESMCSVDGEWNGWSTWENCLVTCGLGKRRRVRFCASPSPKYGGLPCEGLKEEWMECIEKDCPVNGDWTKWSEWTTCSLSCNGGYMTRHRKCDSPVPDLNVSNCRGVNLQNVTCNANTCPEFSVANSATVLVATVASCTTLLTVIGVSGCFFCWYIRGKREKKNKRKRQKIFNPNIRNQSHQGFINISYEPCTSGNGKETL